MWPRSVLVVGLAWGTVVQAHDDHVHDAPTPAAPSTPPTTPPPTPPTTPPTTPPPAAQQTVVRARRLDRPVGDAVIEALPTTAALPAGGTASDLLRRAPGVFISQHSGQGKAHQIFLRGFDAEHGQDLEITVDGVPQNDVSHLHGQGYADVTLLPPELVRRLVLRPGAYDVRQGDFAVAGSLDFQLAAPAPGPLLRTTLGDFGLMRLVGIMSPAAVDTDGGGDQGRTFVAVETARGDGFGPRRAFQRASAVGQGRLTFGDDDEVLIAALVGASRFEAPGVLRESDVDAGLVGPFDVYDDQQGGETRRAQASATVSMHDGGFDIDGRLWSAFHHHDLVQNFTGALLRDEGDRVRQRNTATIGGLDLEVGRRVALFGLPIGFALGTRNRLDNVHQRQERLALRGDDVIADGTDVDADLTLGHIGVFGEARAVVLPGLVVRGGLRTETLVAAIDKTPDDDSDSTALAFGTVLAPRLMVGWRAIDADNGSLVLSVAAGEGFRTPQGRSLGDLEVAQLTKTRGADLGARVVVGNGLDDGTDDGIDLGVTAFITHVESDRVFDHVAARNLFLGPTLRTGVTASATVAADAVLPGLTIGTAWTAVSARVLDQLGSSSGAGATLGSTVPYAPPLVGRVEFIWRHAVAVVGGDDVVVAVDVDPWLVGPRPMPLAEVSPEIFVVDGSASVGWRRLSVSVEASNILDAVVVDGAFVYASDFSAFGGSGSGLPARHVTSGGPRFLSASLSVGW